MREARKDWHSLSPTARQVLLGERPRGVARALTLLGSQGLVEGFGLTARGKAAADWGRDHGDLGWASWDLREQSIDGACTVEWAAHDWRRWRDILRAAVGLPPLEPEPTLWTNGATPLVRECLVTPVGLARGLSAAQAHYLLDCTALPGAIGYAIHGYHVRVMATLSDNRLAQESGGCAYYTPLGQATVAVMRGPREFRFREVSNG